MKLLCSWLSIYMATIQQIIHYVPKRLVLMLLIWYMTKSAAVAEITLEWQPLKNKSFQNSVSLFY